MSKDDWPSYSEAQHLRDEMGRKPWRRLDLPSTQPPREVTCDRCKQEFVDVEPVFAVPTASLRRPDGSTYQVTKGPARRYHPECWGKVQAWYASRLNLSIVKVDLPNRGEQ